MTITLSWWMLPLFILIVGATWAYISERNDSGYLRGLGAMIIVIVTIVATVSMVIGHFI